MIKYLALLGLLIIVILMFMVLVRFPYLLIKNMRVSFKLARELKKNTTQQKQAIQQLRNDWEEMKRQNLTHKTLEAKMRLLNFKESLPLYAKECKIIFSILILIFLLEITFSTTNFVWWKSDSVSFIMLIWTSIWIGTLLVVPIIGVMGIKLTRKLRETLLKLDEAIEQRDQAIRVQNAQSEKEQGETK
ncbi:hypothetical protein [Bartonella krasnovii]|uniref:DUF106 domain-containing protein n=1 Tax=Bartonella krasnovii TaxID=2267275 RepID=A0ABY3VUZ7_9HYPH|nr:hypothetical protein [Bartonella krasnovii]UNF28855.1 hypothetical protein MNL13_06520 [Bartonella krasnovii]UNF35225.1 hypothetical protein MNL12_06505 [Bartonella krasnovii]UNF36852.1 hypothetical protein MNL11_07175 [Bartonella krasnovii]UNF38539.1 hypothetical protein MNL10_07370 [Bartonella krasnovii]UNF40266.1 hypothetical protein MNL09_07445 [Bartonella krasnovii]